MNGNFEGRFELKFILERMLCHDLIPALEEHVRPDAQGDEFGRYLVTSLYYDSADYRAYWDKVEGHRFRRKVRVRIYGEQVVTPNTSCFVEIKQRQNKTIQKRRASLPYSEAVALCGAGAWVEDKDTPDCDRAVIEEVRYLQTSLKLQPACIVAYERLALGGTEYEPDLRITFDTDLTGRVRNLSLLRRSDIHNHMLLSPDLCVMEVKVNRRVPYWLTEVIAKYGCRLRRISKYCTALEHAELPFIQKKSIY